jgi:hypothetical protein
MYEYVNANAGPGAPTARRVAGLMLGTSAARGPVVKKSARFNVIGNLLNALAAGTTLRWSVKELAATCTSRWTRA